MKHKSKSLVNLINIVFLIAFVACNKAQYEHPQINNVNIDTTKKGNLGEPGSSITISKYKDSTLVGYHEKYWIDSETINIKDQYMDSTGEIRFGYYKYSSGSNKYHVSYNWYDVHGNNILSIDSQYVFNKLEELEISLDRINPTRYDLLEYLIEKKYKNNKLYEIVISDFNTNYNYSEKNGEYYRIASDVPLPYAEWEHSSKKEFGRAYGRAVDYLFNTLKRIDNKYIDTAKFRHDFDLLSFLKNYNY